MLFRRSKNLRVRSHANRLHGESLEDRRLLSINPTPFEQALLEDINRFRADPAAELNVIFSNLDPLQARDPDVQTALDFFKVNRQVLLSQWNQLQSAPPLAWNEILMGTAAAHSQLMIQTDMQEHRLPGEPSIGDRISAAGYDYQSFSENIFAYAESHLHTHAGFVVDWGETSTGIQQPPGHRINILDRNVVEVGMSVLAENSSRTGVGPFVVTQDFGEPARFQNPFLLGVAWADANGNDIYDPGEGMRNVSVTIRGGGRTYQTTTMDSGGYQIRVAPGTYSLEASGGQLATEYTQSSIVVSGTNVKADITGFLAIPPIADNDTATSIAGESKIIDVLANDLSVMGPFDFSTLTIKQQPAYGDILVDTTFGRITYTPDADFSGTDYFRYTIKDDQGNESNTAVVTVTVAPFQLEAVNDTVATYSNQTITIQPLTNDVGATGSPTIVIDSQPSNGVVSIAGSQLTYRSNDGFLGQDSIEYHFVAAGGNPSNIATILISVADVAAGWQNPVSQFDVDGDGVISPLDAILVINEIGRTLAAPTSSSAPPPWIDIDGDNVVSPIDAILVINKLDRSRAPSSGAAVRSPLSGSFAVREFVFAETGDADEDDDGWNELLFGSVPHRTHSVG